MDFAPCALFGVFEGAREEGEESGHGGGHADGLEAKRFFEFGPQEERCEGLGGGRGESWKGLKVGRVVGAKNGAGECAI